MNLEGTKHEKAVLVVISFIIGFTCSFIAFGVGSKSATSLHDEVVATTEETSTLVTPDGMPYTPPTENPPESSDAPPFEEAAQSGEPVSYEEGKLFAQVGEDRYVLSIRSDEMPNTNVQGFSTQGIHEALPAYKASPDGAFIYFCEQQTEKEECTNFVFDTASRVIQFVSVDGKKLTTPDSDAVGATWSEAGLTIGSYRSASVDTPWKLISAE